jgi:acyl-coenzyme A thioesterase PaaI-like protein
MSTSPIVKLVSATNLLPDALQSKLLSTVFGNVVPMVGTAGIRYDLLTPEKVICSIKNRRKMQNHIGSVHAVAIALLAETATGFVVSMNIQPGGIVLIKSIKMDYKKMVKGDIIATATLTASQRELMATTPKGETSVACIVTDATGQSPIEVEMIWVWLPKGKVKKNMSTKAQLTSSS